MRRLTRMFNNFPPGVLQADPRNSNTSYNRSNGTEVRGPGAKGIIITGYRPDEALKDALTQML